MSLTMTNVHTTGRRKKGPVERYDPTLYSPPVVAKQIAIHKERGGAVARAVSSNSRKLASERFKSGESVAKCAARKKKFKPSCGSKRKSVSTK